MVLEYTGMEIECDPGAVSSANTNRLNRQYWTADTYNTFSLFRHFSYTVIGKLDAYHKRNSPSFLGNDEWRTYEILTDYRKLLFSSEMDEESEIDERTFLHYLVSKRCDELGLPEEEEE